VFDARSGKRKSKTFPTLGAAKSWRQDMYRALRAGAVRFDATNQPTIREAAEAWITGARAGQVRNRSGDEFKPSAIRAYEQNLRLRVLPVLADRRLDQVRRMDLQRLVDDLVASGVAPSTVRTAILPLRAVYRRAVSRGEVQDNPTRGLELPAIRRQVRYVQEPGQAERLLDALDGADRVLWATALYSGLRRGELVALRW
jgi:integrase